MLTRRRLRVNEIRFSRILRAARWLPAILWMSFLFYLSHQAAPLERVAADVDPFLAHVAVDSILACLLHVALAGYKGAAPRGVLASIAFVLTGLSGRSYGIAPGYVPGRIASELDLAADAVGAVIGVGLASLAASRIYARSITT